MADRKNSVNLLFSSDTEFSFPVPFIPVSQAQAADSSLLSADESTDVGEEDSFVGQTSASTSHPSTFTYFTQAANNNDPFANIGHLPFTTTAAPPVGTASLPVAPTDVPLTSAGHSVQDPFTFQSPQPQPGSMMPPVSQYISTTYQNTQHAISSSTVFPPVSPPQTQHHYNPYRQSSQTNRASPYFTPPQLQQSQNQGHQQMPSFQSTPPVNHLYQTPPTSTPQASVGQGVLLPPAPKSIATAVQPLLNLPCNIYEPVRPHWFYCKLVEGKPIWMPFSFLDTAKLEEVYNSIQPDPENVIVSTDGGRYDIQLYDRTRHAVYWEEEPSEVRRCTWFYKGDMDSRFIPYSEEFSEKLEGEYKKTVTTNQWHKRLEFSSGETIVMHNPKVIVQFQASSQPDEWGTTPDGQTRPRVVKRGIDDDHDEIPEGELPDVNHLVFMAHGIGPVCDLRFRSIAECVDDFRNVSLKLLRTHFKKAVDEKKITRIEFLPVHWHSALHGDATGVDRHMKKITLPSIGRLRHFTNETLLDIFFYNSPAYCQTIVDKAAAEINRLYALFLSRNPNFKGGISLAGHSLGSLILFDLLANQTGSFSAGDPTLLASNGTLKDPIIPEEAQENQDSQDPEVSDELKDETEEDVLTLPEALESVGLSEYLSTLEKEEIDMESLLMCTVDDLKEMGIPLGPRKKIANFVKERVNAQTKKKAAKERKTVLEALKKAQQEEMQKSKDGIDQMNSLTAEKQLGLKKMLSYTGTTISSVTVHYDHFEAGAGQVSVVYPALDFKPDNFFALGSPIGMFLTMRGLEKIDESYQLPTCKRFFNIYHPLDPVAYRMEPMILPDLSIKPVLVPHHKGRKRLHLELKESLSRMGSDLKQGFISSLKNAWQTLNEFARAHTSSTQLQAELEKVANQIKEEEEKHVEEEQKLVESPESPKDEDSAVKIGMLNGGHRIDYVLQEKPIESFNEYLFALQSHLCYWESEDTALLFLKEVYKSMDISPEQPQH
ncbi:SEC23-interacting protein isoform X1 [Chiloscyllium plagiosum]|uniref:SEC23-interacting protein isoform X1 n=1 Tax=Chiloscyllium plagiosum TaxID=36176 RepID=UPI001CB80399|nr:SEC23-interacting protein isoform X1 [Chiloscyllium plagiosum]